MGARVGRKSVRLGLLAFEIIVTTHTHVARLYDSR